MKLYHKQYEKDNKEKIAKRKKEYAKNNKAQLSEYHKQYEKDNKEKRASQKKEYYRDNKDKIEDAIEKYRNNHKEKLRKYRNEWQNNKRKNNPMYRLNINISRDINRSLKDNKKGRHWEDLIGYTLDDIKRHLESQFTEGMTWDNYGKNGWWIDHVIPCVAFDLTKIKEQRKCFNYKNLQPLWWRDNIVKNSYYNNILIRRAK